MVRVCVCGATVKDAVEELRQCVCVFYSACALSVCAFIERVYFIQSRRRRRSLLETMYVLLLRTDTLAWENGKELLLYINVSCGARVRMCVCVCVLSLCSDPPLREFILHLNEKRQLLIRDLDSTHVFVHTEHVDYIRTELERFRKNTSFETVVEGE